MIPDDGLGSASKEDGEEQEMEERHWEDLWHLELDNMEDSPILEMGVKPVKTQCHQQAPEQECNSDFGLDKDRKKESRQGF